VLCVTLPATPAGQWGAPRGPGSIAAGGTPSAAIAVRAQNRAVVNSRRRLSSARAMTASSSG
jgi:hypothetical protein